MARQTRVMIKSSDANLIGLLEKKLNSQDFDLVVADASSSILDMIMSESPDVLIMEHEPAQTYDEVTVSAIKKVRPGLKIILISDISSADDARIVEQGIFYYMTKPVGEEIIQVIQAADHVIRRSKSHGTT